MTTFPSLPEVSADPRADALARSIYLFLKDRALVDKVLVHRALQDATAHVLPETGAQERALGDVRLCAEAIGCPFPSKKQYIAWRSAQPYPNEHLSESAIRNAFGGWREMHAALGAATVADPTTLRLLAAQHYTSDGLVRTLKAWYDAIGGPDADPRALVQTNCHRWITERRRAGDRPDLELPYNRGVWARVFGGWLQALAAAGLLAHRARGGVRTNLGTLDADDDQLLADLRNAASELEGVPTMRGFDRWVVAARAEAAARNEVLDLFQAESYVRRFGSWSKALHRAGLITETEQLERERRSPRNRYTDEEALAAVREYLADTAGQPTSGERYTAWRKQAIAAGAGAGQARAIPSERYLRSRFDSFEQAVKLALLPATNAAQEA